MSIYLAGLHSPSHGMDRGQGWLWGQKHHFRVPQGQPDGLMGSGESSMERKDWPLHREGSQRPLPPPGGDQEVLYVVCRTRP